MAYETITIINATSAPPTPPDNARRKLSSSVRPDVAARNATYDRQEVTTAKANEEARKKCGVIARTPMLRAAKAAKQTPETAPIIVTAQRIPLTM
jgi:hypothetical protein